MVASRHAARGLMSQSPSQHETTTALARSSAAVLCSSRVLSGMLIAPGMCISVYSAGGSTLNRAAQVACRPARHTAVEGWRSRTHSAAAVHRAAASRSARSIHSRGGTPDCPCSLRYRRPSSRSPFGSRLPARCHGPRLGRWANPESEPVRRARASPRLSQPARRRARWPAPAASAAARRGSGSRRRRGLRASSRYRLAARAQHQERQHAQQRGDARRVAAALRHPGPPRSGSRRHAPRCGRAAHDRARAAP